MEMRANKVKEKLQNGERAYIAAGNAHASDIDAFGNAAVECTKHCSVNLGELLTVL